MSVGSAAHGEHARTVLCQPRVRFVDEVPEVVTTKPVWCDVWLRHETKVATPRPLDQVAEVIASERTP